MSTTKLTKGLVRIEKNEPREVGIATRVTGANLGAVTHIISLEAERVEELRVVAIGFREDGSLAGVTIQQETPNNLGDLAVDMYPGDYLVLESGNSEAEHLDADTFNELFRPIA